MAYNEFLADRIRAELKQQGSLFTEKKMMGGLTFMVDDKMCVGIVKDQLMARVNPDEYENLLKRPGAEPMMFTGKEMKGYIFVSSEIADSEEQLSFWVSKCLAYNPLAKSSKK